MRIELSWPRLWRRFITTPLLQALAIGLLAWLLATGLSALAPMTFTALNWTLYDTWLQVRAPIATSGELTVLVGDADSEERFGPDNRVVVTYEPSDGKGNA